MNVPHISDTEEVRGWRELRISQSRAIGGRIEYRCPICDVTLAYDEKEAKKILRKEEE